LPLNPVSTETGEVHPVVPWLFAHPKNLCEDLHEGKTVETSGFSFVVLRSAMPLWREDFLAYLTHLGVCGPSKATDGRRSYSLTNAEAKSIMALTLAL